MEQIKKITAALEEIDEIIKAANFLADAARQMAMALEGHPEHPLEATKDYLARTHKNYVTKLEGKS